MQYVKIYFGTLFAIIVLFGVLLLGGLIIKFLVSLGVQLIVAKSLVFVFGVPAIITAIAMIWNK